MENFKTIKSWVYNPTKTLFGQKSGKAVFIEIKCNNNQNCALFENTQCVLCNFSISGFACPYGRESRTIGYSRKAKKFTEFINKYEELSVKSGLRKFDKSVAYIGDYVFLNVTHLALNESLKPFVKKGSIGYFGSSYIYIDKKDFTADFIHDYIINFSPSAMFGGTIEKYKNKFLPDFYKHLNDLDKDLFNEVLIKVPSISEYMSNIGRKAYIATINPNVGTIEIDKKLWKWDGERLHQTDNNKTVFILNGKYDELTLKPTSPETLACIITDEEQVNENTLFSE